MPSHDRRICAFCGCPSASTDDHLPPKGIFAQPRPSDLITVRACQECNAGTSVQDEDFIVHIYMACATHPNGQHLFESHLGRILDHNTRLRDRIASEVRVNYSGEAIYNLGNHPDPIIKKIICGLHYKHTGNIVVNNAKITPHFYGIDTNPPGSLARLLPVCDHVVIGNGVFRYWYKINHNAETLSSWIFQFYDIAWFGGKVEPTLS